MSMELLDVNALAQFGFAAIMAAVIWRAFEQLSLRIVQVVENNTRAYEQLSAAVQRNTNVVAQLEQMVRTLQQSVAEIEKVIELREH